MLHYANENSTFAIVEKQDTVFSHSSIEPGIMFGAGKIHAKSRHGSFKITEKNAVFFAPKAWQVKRIDENTLILIFPKLAEILIQKTGNRICFSVNTTDPKIQFTKIILPAKPGEHIYGCGEQYTFLDLKGKKVPIISQEQGIGRGRDLLTFLAELTHGAGGHAFSTYLAAPVYFTNQGSGFFAEDYSYSVFSFRNPRRNELTFYGIPQKFHLFHSNSLEEALSEYSGLVGRQLELPDWVFEGAILGIQGGSHLLREKLQTALSAGIDISALWAQDWEGQKITNFGTQLFWNWSHCNKLYPDIGGLINELDTQNIRFLGYVNPFLDKASQMYKEAASQGFLVRHNQGHDIDFYISSFPAGLIDLSNTNAFKWLQAIIQENLCDYNMAGWMADFAEYLPFDASLHSKDKASWYHNYYPVKWAQLNREIIEKNAQKNLFVFHRSGFWGSAPNTHMIWAGDQMVNWSMDDGLATVIPAALSLGMSGFGYHHSDIGGYTTLGWIRRTKELFLRWAEQAVFTPVMRTHEGNRPERNWQHDTDLHTLKAFARLSKIHTLLAPYSRAASREYQKTGVPLMRPVFLHYPDGKTENLQYEYLYGRDLLVAPVYKPKRSKWKVYLPDDQWIHLWSGKPAGSKPEVLQPAPIGYPPVYYRKSSPFRELFQEIGKKFGEV